MWEILSICKDACIEEEDLAILRQSERVGYPIQQKEIHFIFPNIHVLLCLLYIKILLLPHKNIEHYI